MNNGLVGAFIGGGATCVVAFLTLRHQERIAREQLLQSRFAPAYLTLQRYISRWRDHAQWNLEFLKFISTPEPEMPQVSEVEAAQVALFASDEAVAAMNDFAKAVSAYRLAVGNLVHVRQVQAQTQGLTGPAAPELKPAMDLLRATATALVKSAGEVHQRLRGDLRGKGSKGPVTRLRLSRRRLL
jgi:hypothetical protein